MKKPGTLLISLSKNVEKQPEVGNPGERNEFHRKRYNWLQTSDCWKFRDKYKDTENTTKQNATKRMSKDSGRHGRS